MMRRLHDIMELKHPKWIKNFQDFDPVADTNLDSKIAAELLDLKESEKFQNLSESEGLHAFHLRIRS